MAGARDESLYSAGPWPRGINNVSNEGELPTHPDTGKPVALRDALNVDLSSSGWPRRRPGATKLVDATVGHSLWSHESLSFGLFVDGARLKLVNEDMRVEDLDLLVGNLPLSYALINDRIYFSNGVSSGMLTMDRAVLPWAPEQPGRPELSLVSGYSMRAGTYQIAVTFVDALGRESGAQSAAAINVGGNEGIQIELPVPGEFTTRINVYMTNADDSVLRLSASLPAMEGMQLTHVITAESEGRVLATQFLEPLPPGHIVRYHNGRQYVASDNEMRWSEPLRYGMWNPKNRIIFNDRIALLEPIGDGSNGAGVYVAAGNRTYWIAGADPKDYRQEIAHGHGAVRGTQTTLPAEVFNPGTEGVVVAWLSANGHFVVGTPGGKIASLKEGEAVTDVADEGAAMYRADGGIQRVTVSLRGAQPHALSVRDTAVAHIIHRGA